MQTSANRLEYAAIELVSTNLHAFIHPIHVGWLVSFECQNKLKVQQKIVWVRSTFWMNERIWYEKKADTQSLYRLWITMHRNQMACIPLMPTWILRQRYKNVSSYQTNVNYTWIIYGEYWLDSAALHVDWTNWNGRWIAHFTMSFVLKKKSSIFNHHNIAYRVHCTIEKN